MSWKTALYLWKTDLVTLTPFLAWWSSLKNIRKELNLNLMTQVTAGRAKPASIQHKRDQKSLKHTSTSVSMQDCVCSQCQPVLLNTTQPWWLPACLPTLAQLFLQSPPQLSTCQPCTECVYSGLRDVEKDWTWPLVSVGKMKYISLNG